MEAHTPTPTSQLPSPSPSPLPLPLSDVDRRHLRRVALFHYLAGLFFGLAGLIFLASLGLGAYVLIVQPAEMSEPEMLAASKLLMGLSAILLAGCWVPAGMLMVLGWLLGHCRAYRLCLWLTGVQSVILFPFGPVLGVYVYKVVNRPAVKAKFLENKNTGR